MIEMDRRQFLSLAGAACASLAFGKMVAHADNLPKLGRVTLPLGMYIIDAHEHPDHFYLPDCLSCDSTSTVDLVNSLWMNGTSFSAVGDHSSGSSLPPVDFDQLRTQLQYVKDLEASGKVMIVRKYSDIPKVASATEYVPRAILSVEGAAPIVADLTSPNDLNEVRNRIWTLYEDGVRLITLMHYQANGIGDVMTSDPVNMGLTEMGVAIVEQMIACGMVIDVAHAHIDTLRDIAEIAHSSRKPIIDSHTSPSYLNDPYPDPAWPEKPLKTRLRSWLEIEMIVEKGGLFCTWPLKVSRPGKPSNRETILDWANEILMLKTRYGIKHIGLGTDSGGALPGLVDGWESIMNVTDLSEAMQGVGLKMSDVKAYMGGNLLKVLKKCIGNKIKSSSP